MRDLESRRLGVRQGLTDEISVGLVVLDEQHRNRRVLLAVSPSRDGWLARRDTGQLSRSTHNCHLWKESTADRRGRFCFHYTISKPIRFGEFVMVVKSIEEFWFTIVTLPTTRVSQGDDSAEREESIGGEISP